MEVKNKRKPKFIGMRVVKTVIAVYISFFISHLRGGIPFYSAIASILSMQSDYKSSIDVAKSRIIGTMIGGGYGIIEIMARQYMNFEWPAYIQYLILSLFLIPIIYTNVFLKVKKSTYISCVVFFSITASVGRTIGPFSFAINRIIDTLIGIVVSLFVNLIL